MSANPADPGLDVSRRAFLKSGAALSGAGALPYTAVVNGRVVHQGVVVDNVNVSVLE